MSSTSVFCHTPIGLWQYFVDQSYGPCDFFLERAQQQQSAPLTLYLAVFALTILLELPFYYAMLRDRPILKRLQWIFLINLATHPLVGYGFPYLFKQLNSTVGACLLASEIFAPVVEALLLFAGAKMPLVRAFAISLAANIFSWWVGVYLVSWIF